MMREKFDLQIVRADTPGVNNTIFFNNAGASLRPRQVTDTVKKYLDAEDALGGHEASSEAADRIIKIYDSAAKLINAQPDEIALMESNTRAWHSVIYAMDLQKDDEVVLSAAEYISGQAAFVELQKRRGIVLHIIGYDENGFIDLVALRNCLSSKTRLVALTHISTSNGTVHPVEEAGEIIKAGSGALYLLDACQSIGQIKVDVSQIGCDALTFTGRKYLRAPRGTGALYVSRTWFSKLFPLLPDGHRSHILGKFSLQHRPDARRFEVYETNFASMLGLGAAIDYALALGIECIQDQICALSQDLRKLLQKTEGIIVHEQNSSRSGIVTFSVEGIQADAVAKLLHSKGILVKPVNTNTAWLDLSTRNLDSAVRASVHYFNTKDEVRKLHAEITACREGCLVN